MKYLKKLIRCALLMVAAALSLSLTAFAATRIDTPEAYWDEDDKTVAMWDEVENAKSYQVYLYRMTASSTTWKKVKDITTKKLEYDFEKQMDTEGEYCLKIRALAKSGYSDSKLSDYSDSSYISETYAEWLAGGKKNPDLKTTGPGAITSEDSTQTAETTEEEASETDSGTWYADENGWRYIIDTETSQSYTDGWHWIDSDGDGVSECYYFGTDGYILTSATTPDGYLVDENGAWIIDGIIQTQ